MLGNDVVGFIAEQVVEVAPAVKWGKKKSPPNPTITKEQADDIHGRIRDKVVKTVNKLAADLVEIAKDLQDIYKAEAWSYYAESWTAYLEQHREFSRSYMFNLAKLGQAGDEALTKFLAMGIGASQLIEYARIAPEASKIQSLVESTWESLKEVPIRKLASEAKATAPELFADEQKPKKPKGKLRKKSSKTRIKAIQKVLAAIPAEERRAFFDELSSLIIAPWLAEETRYQVSTKAIGTDASETVVGEPEVKGGALEENAQDQILEAKVPSSQQNDDAQDNYGFVFPGEGDIPPLDPTRTPTKRSKDGKRK